MRWHLRQQRASQSLLVRIAVVLVPETILSSFPWFVSCNSALLKKSVALDRITGCIFSAYLSTASSSDVVVGLEMVPFLFGLNALQVCRLGITMRPEAVSLIRIFIIRPRLFAVPLFDRYPCWSTCGRRTRPFSGRVFREHRTTVGVLPIFLSWGSASTETMPDVSPLSLPNSLTLSSRMGAD